MGLDLNFDDTLLQMAKGYESDMNGRLNYLITTSINYGSSDPDFININEDKYLQINNEPEF